MKPQPDFERLLKTLAFEEPDRVPIAELQIDPPVPEAFLGKPIRGLADEIQFWKEAGYDYFVVSPGNIVSDLHGQLNAPAGKTCTSYGGPTERKWACEHEGIFKSRTDMEKLSSLMARSEDYEQVRESLKLLPDGMGLIVHVGGFFEHIWQLMGFERFSIALADERDFAVELWEKLNTALMNHFEAVMDFDGVSGIWLCDDIAYTEGLMISPALLRQYVFPYHKRIGRACRGRGVPLLYHSDGDLTQVLYDIIDNGVNALHPIEPKAMDIYELKRRYYGTLAFVGNIDLGSTLTRGTPAEVREDVRKHIEVLAPGGGYVVSSSNTIPDYVPLENYKAMLEAVFEFGRYPIGSA